MPKKLLVISIQYKSLKELLQNEINIINKQTFIKWTILTKYISLVIITEGLKKNNIITQTHLISILMYCNFQLYQKNLHKHTGEIV